MVLLMGIHAALNLIPELANKVDTCMLHGLQRSVLYSIGLTGAACMNPLAKNLLRHHKRCVSSSPPPLLPSIPLPSSPPHPLLSPWPHSLC